MSMQVEERNSTSGSGSRGHVSHPSEENAGMMDQYQRMETFGDFPPPLVVNIIQLAKFGFKFTPTVESPRRSTCVRCHKAVNEWNAGDQPFREQFHEQGCLFVKEGSESSPMSISQASLSNVGESLPRATVGNIDESTKPLEPGPSFSHFDVPQLPPSQPMGQNVQSFVNQTKTRHQRPSRYAHSLPPQSTRLSVMAVQSTEEQNRRTTAFTQIRQTHARSQGYPESPTPSMLSSINSRYLAASAATGAAWPPEQHHPSILSQPEDENQELLPTAGNVELQTLIDDLDMRNATNRLYTFEQYWSEDNEFTNTRLLADRGFYCIGQGDAVECFCCHVVIANWSRNDNPQQRHIEMSSICRFIQGRPCGDIPLPVERRRPPRTRPIRGRSQPPSVQSQLSVPHGGQFLHRSSSQHSSPMHSLISQPSQEGAFSPRHVTQHSSISPQRSHSRRQASPMHSISSHPSHGGALDPWPAQHSSLSPHPSPSRHGQQTSPMHSIVSHPSVEGAVVGPQPGSYSNPTTAMVSRSNLMVEFPCAAPANPRMREERARLQTFNNPQFRLHTPLIASNLTLAQAGLYYTGIRDSVKCWFCNGGLRHFRQDDDPWVEHAKFFPQCEYLLQQRGPGWINTISTLNPNVERPPFPRGDLSRLPEVVSSPTPLPPPPVYTQEQQDELNRQMLEEGMASEPTTTALNMGYSRQTIRQLQLTKILIDGCCYQTTEALLNALLGTPPPPQPRSRYAYDSAQRNNAPSNSYAINGTRFLGPSLINDQFYPPPSSYSGTTSSASSEITINGQPLEEFMANAFDNPFFHGDMDDLFTGNGGVTVINSHPPVNTTTFHNNIIGGQPGNVHRFPLAGANRFRSTASVRPAAPTVRPPTPPPLSAMEIPRLPGRSSASTAASTSTSTTSSPSTSGASSNTPNAASAQERLTTMERERTCKICLTQEADILFQPCNHICSCEDCARRVTSCPVCRRRITRYIRTYHS